jgi:hypothetical protein
MSEKNNQPRPPAAPINIYMALIIFMVLVSSALALTLSARDIILLTYSSLGVLFVFITIEVLTRYHLLPKNLSPHRAQLSFLSKPLIWFSVVFPAGFLLILGVWLILKIVLPEEISALPNTYTLTWPLLLAVICLQISENRRPK